VKRRQTIYVCTGCGNCCRWPGYVHVNDAEINRIADFLGMPLDDFLERHTRLTDDRRGLSLNEHADGTCEFLSGNNECRIQDVKPRQCRDFPNHWAFDGWQSECPAVALKLRRDRAPQTHVYASL
jgi:Fe-S-cluster containining protein